MKALVLTNWKRWVATFCVALVALVMVGRAFSTDRDCGAQWPVAPSSYEIASLEKSDAGKSDPSPINLAQHHCCSAHVADLSPLLPHSGLIVPTALDVAMPSLESKAPRERPSGFDRPPRISAAV